MNMVFEICDAAQFVAAHFQMPKAQSAIRKVVQAEWDARFGLDNIISEREPGEYANIDDGRSFALLADDVRGLGTRPKPLPA